MTLRAQNQRWKTFVEFSIYRLYRENGQFMPQELFPFVVLAPRVLNLGCRHYYLSEKYIKYLVPYQA